MLMGRQVGSATLGKGLLVGTGQIGQILVAGINGGETWPMLLTVCITPVPSAEYSRAGEGKLERGDDSNFGETTSCWSGKGAAPFLRYK